MAVYSSSGWCFVVNSHGWATSSARSAVPFRSLYRTPAFTAVALVSLTLAVGANTAVFTLLNALVWRDAAVRDPHTLVQLSTINQTGQEGGLSWPALQELRRREDVFSATLGWLSGAVMGAETSAGATQVGLSGVSGDFYAELGVVPAAGRLIADQDIDIDRDVASPIAVIGWSFWQRVYGGLPSALGQEIRLEGVPVTIVGVAPKDFKGLGLLLEPDVTVPLALLPRMVGGEMPMKQGSSQWIQVTGRLRPDVSVVEARARLTAAWPALLERPMPRTFAGAQREAFLAARLVVTPAARGVDRMLRPRFTQPLLAILAIAAVIAIITAINLCGLAFARAGMRIHEFRVRLTLGAGRLRLMREATAEGLLLGVTAAASSVVVAWCISDAAARLILQDTLVLTSLDVRPDVRVVVVATGIAVGIAVLMSLAPVWRVGHDRADLATRSNSRTVARSGRAGRVLLVAQVALSVVLLVGCALLLRSLSRITSADAGVQSSNVLVGYPSPVAGAYRRVDPESYYRQTLERLGAIPGVEAAAFTQFQPGGGALPPEAVAPAGTARDSGGDLMATATQVSPGFFAALGISVQQGRAFNWNDNANSRRVAILSHSLASRLFGPGGSIGQRIRISARPDSQDLEVVGVVSDARVYDVRSANLLTAYTSSLQYGENANWKALVLRGPVSALPEVRRVFDAIGVETLPRVTSLDYVVSRTVLGERMMAMLAAFFGGLALLLAVIGIHGQMSYTLAMQRKEIGVRIALGANARRIIGLVVGRGATIGLAGAALGVFAALPLVGVLRSLLVEVSPYDPLAFAAAPALLLAAILAACLMPALRATTVDPMVELRRD